MTVDLAHDPIHRERPAPAQPRPVDTSPTSTPMARRLPAAWECGLDVEEHAMVGTRCRDIIPELIIELI